MSNKSFSETVTAKELGWLIGIGPRRVQQLGKIEVFQKAKRGQYFLEGAVQAYTKHLVESETGKVDKGKSRDSFEFERARNLKLRNDKAELTLVDMKLAVATVDFIIGELRADLSGLPARISDDLGVRRELENGIDQVLGQLAGRYEEAGEALCEGRNPFEADGEGAS